MKDRILQLLKDIEQKHNVKVLLAVNSGSRCFGYASETSDWDVRFIYVHKPEWYFSITQTSDVIEYMNEEDGLDAEGFDLKKALTLLTKTNPIESDWLHSKEFFVCDEDFLKAMLQFEANCYNTKSAMYHFYSMCVKHNDRYLQKEITLKRFIYYMRGLLACRWVEIHGTHPSVNLDELIDATITDNELVRTQAHALLALKRSGKQYDNSEVNEELVNYINDTRQHYEELLPQYRCEKPQFDSAIMSRFLMDLVMRYE